VCFSSLGSQAPSESRYSSPSNLIYIKTSIHHYKRLIV
jgi:hypothetical protein